MPESPSIVVESSNLRVATWRELCFSFWLAPGKVPDVRALHDAQRAFGQRLGREKMILLSVIQARAVVTLDADMRRAVEENTREMQESVKASSVVITATGFAAAAIRSLIAALMLLNRPRYPTRVFDHGDAACDWAASHVAPGPGGAPSPADVRAVYHAVSNPTGAAV